MINDLFLIIFEFMKIGVFAVGGGLASLPFLYDISDRYGWFTHHDLANMIAIAESTPGPIGINMATYVGYTVTGVLGGIVATVAYVLPSLFIVIFVARTLEKFKSNPYIDAIFYGLRPAVCALIAFACFLIMRITLLDLAAFNEFGDFASLSNIPAFVLFAVMTVLVFKLKWHPVVFVAMAAITGAALSL